MHPKPFQAKPLQAKPAQATGPLRLLGYRMPAGFPSPAADYAEVPLDLNTHLVRNRPASFLFTVKGDSMVQAGILEGDQVVVDRSAQAKHQDIVVAVVHGEYTLKRLWLGAGRVELRPENPRLRPMVFGPGGGLEIWGVVVAVMRRYWRS